MSFRIRTSVLMNYDANRHESFATIDLRSRRIVAKRRTDRVQALRAGALFF